MIAISHVRDLLGTIYYISWFNTSAKIVQAEHRTKEFIHFYVEAQPIFAMGKGRRFGTPVQEKPCFFRVIVDIFIILRENER